MRSSGTSQSDTIAPTISATAKVDAETVVLSATVSDNIAVTEVDFVVDDGATKATVTASQDESVFSASLPIAMLSAGSHRMVARALDAAGNATEAGAVSFDIAGGTTSPASPIKITANSAKDGGDVTFTVDIQSDAQIKLTNFFLDGEFLGGRGDDQRHYSFARLLSSGTHRLVVDVSDVQGNSANVEVVVEI